VSVLLDFIRKAIELGADGLEIEYKDGEEWICAMRGAMGVGIGSVRSNSSEGKELLAEIGAMRKAKRVEVDGKTYRVAIREFDSFGETAYRIRLTGASGSRH